MPRQLHSAQELPSSDASVPGVTGSTAGADADDAMSMSVHVDPVASSSSTALPAIDTTAAQIFGSPPLNPAITDAGNPLVSPVFGGPSSSSSHDYASAGEGLSESIHNGGAAGAYARSPVLVAIASGGSGSNLGRTGSLRSAAGKSRAAGSRSGSFSNSSVLLGHSDGHQANGSSSSHHKASANGSATAALAGLGIAGPSSAALALGLNVDDGRFRPLYEGSTIDAREFLRLTMQSLKDLGFEGTARALETESGIVLEHPSIQAFRQAVLGGDWRNAERLLLDGLVYSASKRSSAPPTNASGSSANGTANGSAADVTVIAGNGFTHVSQQVQIDSVLRSPETKSWEYIKFLLHQQRYLELLEAKQTKKALSVLRSRLAPLNYGSGRLQELSSLVICSSSEELKAKLHWEGTGEASRRRLMEEIEDAISPLVMLPSRRLPTLLQQAQTLQKHQDPFYNHPRNTHISLYVDHRSDRSNFPSRSARVLEGHSDEVWDIAFSPDGNRLASAGKDKYVIIWKATDSFEIEHKFGPLTDAVHCVAWSPDGEMLLATSDPDVTLWELATGKSKRLCKHEYRVGTACWLPDGSGFVTGGEDARVIFWNRDGTVRRTWITSPFRLIALDVSPDGKYLISVSFRHSAPPAGAQASTSSSSYPGYSGRDHHSHLEAASSSRSLSESPSASSAHEAEQHLAVDLGGGSRSMSDERYKISFYDISRHQEIGAIYMSEEMSSVKISEDSKYVLINQRPNEARLWDIEQQCMVIRYFGHQMNRNIIRSCFGGVDKNFVISGSEDASIYMYHRSSGRLLEKLEGHGEGCINAVAWHPTNVAMLASCSDDGTVRIWGPGSAQSGYTRIHSSTKPTRQERQVHSDDSTAGPTPFPWAMSPVPPSDFPASPELQSSSDEDEDEAMEEAI